MHRQEENGKYAHLDHLSTEQLQELLRADIESLEEGDTDVIFHILGVIEKREKACLTEVLPDKDKAWAEFQKYYNIPEGVGLSLYSCELEAISEDSFSENKLDAILSDLDEIASQETPFDVEKSLSIVHQRFSAYSETSMISSQDFDSECKPLTLLPSKRRFSKLATIAAAIAIAFISLTGLQVAGFDILGGLVHWTQETFRFGSPSRTAEASIGTYPIGIDEEAYYDSFYDALHAFEVTGTAAPTWLPDKFEHTETIAMRDISNTIIHSTFTNGDRYLFISLWEVTDSPVQHEKDDSSIEVLIWNDITYYLLSNLESESAVWQTGKLEGSIFGNISRDELKEIIYSMNE